MSMLSLAFIHVFKPAQAAQIPGVDQETSKKVFDTFWFSGAWVAGLTALAVVALLLAGKMGTHLAVDWGKVASVVGNGFMGWATWFALWDGEPSWKGIRPDEKARAGIFRCLISAGLFLSIFGGGWWQ